MGIYHSQMHALYLTRDLMFQSQMLGVVRDAHVKLESVDSVDMLLTRASRIGTAAVVILDLSVPQSDPHDLVPKLQQMPIAPKAIVAYAPHVHVAKLAAATAVGCDHVMSQGQFQRQIKSLLSKLDADNVAG